MRVWDVHPGYLNRQSLLGEHQELHGLVSIIKNQKRGYRNHPETQRWLSYGWALTHRHRLLAAEMQLRGYVDRSPVDLRTKPNQWPEVYIDEPAAQFRILKRKYLDRESGRIPLPRNAQQLWAQHKYSVMARDQAAYRDIGRRVASKDRKLSYAALALLLSDLLRQKPQAGGMKNAVQHMWGYVAEYAEDKFHGLEQKKFRSLLITVRDLALEREVKYLKHSTAISELLAWPS